MGEAILVKAGGVGSWSNGGGNTGGQYVPMTEIIQENTVFTMPKTQGQQIAVRIFGGGGGDYITYRNYSKDAGAGGGGGNMNNGILNIPAETKIPIIIGDAGSTNVNGGTTSFGTYLSATGGERGHGYCGGNGGSGGGAYTAMYDCFGGNATYGGGGGGARAGRGGIYGGAGGGYFEGWANCTAISDGGWGNTGQNGFNTIGMGLEFEGAGLAGNNNGGGGGYGGNGGNGRWGGGGGYGGNGGESTYEKYWSGGGGGGYGNDGAKALNLSGGGGGGYGIQGFGHGKGGSYSNAMKGVCILSYSKLVES